MATRSIEPAPRSMVSPATRRVGSDIISFARGVLDEAVRLGAAGSRALDCGGGRRNAPGGGPDSAIRVGVPAESFESVQPGHDDSLQSERRALPEGASTRRV